MIYRNRMLLIGALLIGVVLYSFAPIHSQDGDFLVFGDATCDQRLGSSARDTWLFDQDNNKGADVVIAMFSEDFDSFLELYNTSNNRNIGQDDDSAGGFNSLLKSNLSKEARTYEIYARGISSRASGQYTLILGVRDREQTLDGETRLDFETRSAVEVEFGGDEEWEIALEKDDEVVVAMLTNIDSRTGISDPYLIIRDSNNRVVVEDDDSAGDRNALARFTASRDGIYTIESTTFSRNNTGDYTLVVGKCIQ